MAWQKPEEEYWNNKFTSYMHDPFDKALEIKGHVDRAAKLIQQYGLEMPNNEFWKKADGIAAGFERGQITGHSSDESKSGSVDFLKRPIITHPVGEKNQLDIDLQGIRHEEVWNALKDYMLKEIGTEPGGGGYSDKFKGKPDEFAIARFFYTHLVLRFKLASDNVGGLGALWHRLPADTRFPDHSIWHHDALVSAIQSCFELANNKEDLGVIVFSITPVQGFIEKARKLRDYWTGSLLLSWLAFEGIKWVMENLGPDHILYPSLIDQPLIDEYLSIHWKIDEVNFINKNKQIASFPNKFLFLVPFNLVKGIADEIEEHIRKEWKSLYSLIIEDLIEELGANIANMTVEKIFERQNSNFWDIQWAAVKLLDKDSMGIAEEFLPKKNYENQFNLLNIFLNMIKNKPYYEKPDKGVLYSSSHAFCQSALAAQKTKKEVNREPESGEKCRMCGEFEVLHNKEYQSGISAKEYKGYIDNFWQQIKGKYSESDFDENEKLCSICLTKRLIFKPLKNEKQKEFVLHSAFAEAENFPSTTYIALNNYFKRENIDKDDKKEIADKLFKNDENKGTNDKELLKLLKKITIKDRYYAILLMDGDNMGKLVNGETLASTWEYIMHPDIVYKIKNDKLEDDNYNKLWKEIYNGDGALKKRLLTPSIHAAISESLGDFALYGVVPIIKKFEGKLIYAGGDDVCAVLPIDNALAAANEISDYYKSAFRVIKLDSDKQSKKVISTPINTNGRKWVPEQGKLSVNLGKGNNLTISAGILICHHKENLSEMIKRAHELLNKKAKEEGGRNAVAVELRKRSGGSRYFISKWDGERLKAFKDLIDKEKIGEELSRSLAYRFEEFKNGMEAILSREERGSNSLLEKFVLSQLKKSGMKTTDEKQKKLSEDISKIIKDNNNEFNNEGLIIAGFLTEKTLKNKGGGDD